jgi:hypothetical protein
VVYYQVAVERLSRHEAVKLLRECLRIGKIIPGKHFRDELAEEGLILPDALRVLKTGNIFQEPECDPKPVIGNTGSRAEKWTANGSRSCFASGPRIPHF